MKKLIIVFLFCSIAYSQNKFVKSYILKYKTPQYATVLNGTSQYWSKASPSTVDLSGSEQITNANNTGFETNLGDWTNKGNHSAVRSTVDKRTGTASMRITSSGAGDTTANYMYLPASALGTITSGNKYTVELWARSATATSTVTVNLGTQSTTSGTISTTVGSFTKVVFNFTANGGEDTLKIYGNKAIDSLYIDDVSLKQGFDVLVLFYLNTTSTTNLATYLLIGNASNAYGMRLATGGFMTFLIYDATTTASHASTTAINDGRYNLLAMTINRSGTIQGYVNGVANGTAASVTGVGALSSLTPLGIGARVSNTDRYAQGNYGYVQVVRFNSIPSDIANIIKTIYATKKPLSNYNGGTIAAWYEWKSSGTDKSGKGNHLTPTASPAIIKIP
jgi:hypothetical protein